MRRPRHLGRYTAIAGGIAAVGLAGYQAFTVYSRADTALYHLLEEIDGISLALQGRCEDILESGTVTDLETVQARHLTPGFRTHGHLTTPYYTASVEPGKRPDEAIFSIHVNDPLFGWLLRLAVAGRGWRWDYKVAIDDVGQVGNSERPLIIHVGVLDRVSSEALAGIFVAHTARQTEQGSQGGQDLHSGLLDLSDTGPDNRDPQTGTGEPPAWDDPLPSNRPDSPSV